MLFFLLFQLCSTLATFHGLGCYFLLLLLVALVMFFFCYFLWPWSHSFAITFHAFLLLLFTTLVVLNGLRVFVIRVMDFPREIMFPIEVPLEMDCCVFVFGFEIPTTSISVAKNYAITNCPKLWALTKIFENLKVRLSQLGHFMCL